MLRHTVRRTLTPALSTLRMKNVAVILSGCGVYDGAEVHEASAALVALSRNGANFQVFAPNKAQMHVIDHTTGNEMDESRNVLVESARISRGNAKALDLLDVKDFCALVVPGGFGAAKNLSTVAVKGPDAEVDSDVEKALKSFHAEKKPIGMCCIAPAIAAKVFPGCTVTLGSEKESESWPYAGTVEAVKGMSSHHQETDLSKIYVDEANNLVTAAAFMCNAPFHEVHDNVVAMVEEVLKRSKDE